MLEAAVDVTRTKLLTVRMAESEMVEAERLASARRLSVSDLVRKLLAEEAERRAEEERRERASRLRYFWSDVERGSFYAHLSKVKGLVVEGDPQTMQFVITDGEKTKRCDLLHDVDAAIQDWPGSKLGEYRARELKRGEKNPDALHESEQQDFETWQRSTTKKKR